MAIFKEAGRPNGSISTGMGSMSRSQRVKATHEWRGRLKLLTGQSWPRVWWV